MSRALLCLALALPLAALAADEPPPAPRRRALMRSPEALASFGAALVGDELYLIGGHIGRPHHHSRDNLSTGFYRLDMKKGGAWQELPGGVALQSVALVAHGKKVIRLGGLGARNRENEKEDLHSTDAVRRFDPETGAWTELPSLPEERSSHDAYVSGDTVYVLGGWRLAGDETEWFKHGWTLDLADPKARWTKIEQPFRRRALAVTACAGKVYAIGGITRKGDISSRVDIYDIAAETWSRAEDLPGPGFGAAAVPAGDSLYATDWKGGVHRLEADGAWTTVADMHIPRFFHRLVAPGPDQLLAIAGASFGGKIRHMERIELGPRDRHPRIIEARLPYANDARGAPGLLLRRADLTIFGDTSEYLWEGKRHEADSCTINLNGLRLQETKPFRAKGALPEGLDGRLRAITVGEKAEAAFAVQDGSKSLWRFDVKDKSWRRLEARFPRALKGASLIDHGEALWVFDRQALRRVDPKTEVIETVTEDIGLDVQGAACARLDGAVYFAHQRFGLRVLDLKTRKWSERAGPTEPRQGGELVALEGFLYLAGGSLDAKGRRANKSIEAYDPKSDRWQTVLVDHGSPAKAPRFFAFNKRILLVGFRPAAEESLTFAIIDPRFDGLAPTDKKAESPGDKARRAFR